MFAMSDRPLYSQHHDEFAFAHPDYPVAGPSYLNVPPHQDVPLFQPDDGMAFDEIPSWSQYIETPGPYPEPIYSPYDQSQRIPSQIFRSPTQDQGGLNGYVSMHDVLPPLPTSFDADIEFVGQTYPSNAPQTVAPQYLHDGHVKSVAGPSRPRSVSPEQKQEAEVDVKYDDGPFSLRPRPSRASEKEGVFRLAPTRTRFRNCYSRLAIPPPNAAAPKAAPGTVADSSSFIKLSMKQNGATEEQRQKNRAIFGSKSQPPAPASMATLRPLLAPDVLRSAKPGAVFKYLRSRVINDQPAPPEFQPNPEELREILLALKDGAPEQYLRAMADNEKYARTLADWVKAFTLDVQTWEPAISPMMLMLSRTDMAVDLIQETEIAKLCRRANAKATNAELKSKDEISKAFERYASWLKEKLLPGDRYLKKEAPPAAPENTAKKQKLNDGTPADRPSSSSAAASRPATSSASASTKPAASASAKPAPKTSSATSDMSFFGAPAAPTAGTKRPLPDIKKMAKPVSTSASTAAPASTSLLSATLSQLGRRVESPPVTTPNLPVPAAEEAPAHAGKKKLNKKGFAVRFRDLVPDGGALEDVRLFKQELHELEPAPWNPGGVVHGMSAHQLDMSEGQALRRHGIEEVIDWYEPDIYCDPAEYLGDDQKDWRSLENEVQDARERGILAVTYLSEDQVPAEPSEVGVAIVQRSEQTRTLYPAGSTPAPLGAALVQAAAPNVSDLLRQINLPTGFMPPAAGPPPPQQHSYGYDQYPPPSVDPYAQPSGPPAPPPQSYYSGPGQNHVAPAQGWGAQSQPYPGPPTSGNQPGYSYGPGQARPRNVQNVTERNYKTKVCKFWLRNECAQGDNCTFLHVFPSEDQRQGRR